MRKEGVYRGTRGLKWDVFYIDAHYDMGALAKEEVEILKWKPQGGRRQVIAYLSIGTTELYRWYAAPVMVYPGARSFRRGVVENGIFIPARERLGMPAFLIGCFGRLIRTIVDESTPIWWHPEWRDIIVRGGSPYKNPRYNHSQFADGNLN